MLKLRMPGNESCGMLITFCGLDGCGKTTLINDLSSYLTEDYGITPQLTKQPTGMIRKSKIFRSFMDESIHEGFEYRSLSLLAASDRVQHSNKVIKPMLEKGETVISDRYFYSCLANLRARGYKSDNWIYEISQFIPKPDISFFLDVPIRTALQRVRSRPEERDKYIDVELQFRLRQEYIDIAKMNGGIIISTNQPYEYSLAEVKKNVDGFIYNKYGKNIEIPEKIIV